MVLYSSIEISKIFKKKIKKEIKFDNVNIDSRLKLNNSLFIPIKGPKYDGHDYIVQAFKNGARASLVNNDHFIKMSKDDNLIDFLIPVKNTLESLHLLAKYSRKRSKLKKMICITGSSGKTTLKDWLYEIIKKDFKTYSTKGNFNNQIGLPLTLSRMPKNTEVCILELGTNQPGEIETLTSLSSPDISVITNIGDAHIGNFENSKHIAFEKSKIYSALNNGLAILPFQKDFIKILKKEAGKNSNKILIFGNSSDCDAKIIKIESVQNKAKNHVKLDIMGKKIKFNWNYFGQHWIRNILIILMIVVELNLKFEQVIKHIRRLRPKIGRGSHHKAKIKGKQIFLIDDSYNANPNSMENSIENFLKIELKKQRKVCVLGEMLELGDKTVFFHKKIAYLLNNSNIDFVITVGIRSKIIHDNLKDSINSKYFPDIKKLYNFLAENLIENDLILFKGSNSVKLGQICEKLLKGS